MTDPNEKLLPHFDRITTLKFPSGEKIVLSKPLKPDHLNEISKIWETVRTEEIRRIEEDSKLKITVFLHQHGYKRILDEQVTFR